MYLSSTIPADLGQWSRYTPEGFNSSKVGVIPSASKVAQRCRGCDGH